MRVRRTKVTVGVMCLAMFAAACGSDEEESAAPSGGGTESAKVETISLVQPVPGESSFFYPYLVGRELGFFEDEKIEVKYLSASEKLPLPAFVANGDADVGAAGADEALQAISRGGKFKVYYDEFRTAADVLSVVEDSDIQDASELEGKTIAAAGEDDRVLLRTALDVAGVDEGSVKIVSLGRAGPTTAEALKSGKVDAYASGISDAAVVQAVGDVKLRNILPEEITDRPASSFIVMPEQLEKRRDAIVRFMRAWAMASYVGQVNPEVVKAIGCKAVPAECENEEIFGTILDLSITARDPEGEPYGSLRPQAWEDTQDQLMKAGEYDNAVDVPSILDDALIAEVNEFDKAAVEQAATEYLEQNPGS